MNTDNDDQIEKMTQEIWKLRERIATLEGRREGSARMLGIVIPVAAAILVVLSYAALTSRINAVVDDILKQQIQEIIGSEDFREHISEDLDRHVQEAKVAADAAKDAVAEAQDASAKAVEASSESKASATLTADKASEASEQADEAGQSAKMAADQAEEVAAKATEVQSVLETPTATPSVP